MSDLAFNSDSIHYTGPELWRPIPGFPPCYEISTHGRGRTRRVRVRNGRRGTKVIEVPDWRSVVQATSGKRYKYMTMRDCNGVERTIAVHVLLLLTFVGPCPPELDQVRHLDDVPSHNHISNLCWGTRLENEEDKRRNRTRKRALDLKE
jgi:hypothetical protein